MIGFIVWFDVALIGVADALGMEREKGDWKGDLHSILCYRLNFHGGMKVNGDTTY
jgi:hypothetical protein